MSQDTETVRKMDAKDRMIWSLSDVIRKLILAKTRKCSDCDLYTECHFYVPGQLNGYGHCLANKLAAEAIRDAKSILQEGGKNG